MFSRLIRTERTKAALAPKLKLREEGCNRALQPPTPENPIQNPAPIQAEGKGHHVWQTAGTLLLLVPEPQGSQACAP